MRNPKEFSPTNPDPMDLAPYAKRGPLHLDYGVSQGWEVTDYEEVYSELLEAEVRGDIQSLYEANRNNDGRLDGAMKTNSGYISFSAENPRSNAIISGAAIVRGVSVERGEIDVISNDESKGDLVPVNIVDTKNDGFHYVGEDEFGNTKSIGHMSHACLVGGTDRPEAIIVPLNNELKPVEDAIYFLNNLKDHYEKTAAEECERLTREAEESCRNSKGFPKAELPKAPFEEDGITVEKTNPYPKRFI